MQNNEANAQINKLNYAKTIQQTKRKQNNEKTQQRPMNTKNMNTHKLKQRKTI